MALLTGWVRRAKLKLREKGKRKSVGGKSKPGSRKAHSLSKSDRFKLDCNVGREILKSGAGIANLAKLRLYQLRSIPSTRHFSSLSNAIHVFSMIISIRLARYRALSSPYRYLQGSSASCETSSVPCNVSPLIAQLLNRLVKKDMNWFPLYAENHWRSMMTGLLGRDILDRKFLQCRCCRLRLTSNERCICFWYGRLPYLYDCVILVAPSWVQS